VAGRATPVVEVSRELSRRSELGMTQCLGPKMELKLELESEQGPKHSCPEGLPAAAGLTRCEREATEPYRTWQICPATSGVSEHPAAE
jgi:hypothetical protein